MSTKETISYTNSMQINLVRIAAAWMVLIGHSLSYYGFTIFKDQTYFAYIQNIGVVLLFILSGFLSAYSYSTKGNDYNLKSYVIHKISRVHTTFIPAILLVALIDRIRIFIDPVNYPYYQSYNAKTFVYNVLMLHDFNGLYLATTFGSAKQFWTLTVEWWLYITFGFVTLYFAKRVKNGKVRILDILLLVLLCYNSATNLIGGRGNGLTFYWLLGILIYLIYKKIRVRYEISKILLSLTFFTLSMHYAYKFKDAYNIYFALALFLSICFFMSWGSSRKNASFPKVTKIIAFLSGYTYSLYLVHYSLLDFICNIKMPLSTISKFWIGIILSNIIAIIFSFIFEKKLTPKVEKILFEISQKEKD